MTTTHVATALLLLLAALARADEPWNLPPQKDTLQAVLDRIQQHAAGDAWKQPGFKDDAIEAWLDKLVGSIAKAAEMPELTLPVRLKEMKPARHPFIFPPNSLIVGKDLDLRQVILDRMFVLADGSVEVGIAKNSVIVARGSITIRTSSICCVLVAGTVIQAENDGDRRNLREGSVLASRGWVDVAMVGAGTFIAAGQGITAPYTHAVRFVNAPAPRPPDRPDGLPGLDNGSRSLTVRDLPLEPLPAAKLAMPIRVLGVMNARTADRGDSLPKPVGLVIQYGGQRCFADVGQPILSEQGNALESLRDWRVTSILREAAALCKGDASLVLPLGKR